MSQGTLGQVIRDASMEGSEVPCIIAPRPDTVIPPNSDAREAIVQCLIIATRRGRQIRLTRIGGSA